MEKTVNNEMLPELAGDEERIEWALDHPGLSSWLKDALRNARDQDPSVLTTEVELLRSLILPWAQSRVQAMLEQRDLDGSRRH